MKLTVQRSFAAAIRLAVSVAWLSMNVIASGQGMTMTTVQGTVYLANGRTGSGTLQLSWPAFTTAGNEAVAAGRTNVTIGADGYVSVKLAPNLGSTPAGLYYTAVYHLSDGTTSTEYWVVPAAAQASLAQVRAQVMPAAQAVQAVSKSYVDQSIEELTQSLLTASGGTLSGPLYLNGDPTQTKQAATKHYVDTEFGNAVPMSGAALTGPLTSVLLGAAYQVDQFPGADFGARLQACLNKLDGVYGGTCDARNFSGTLGMGSALVIATANATVQLPCATIATANQIQVTAGTRNVTLRGCALRGASNASGSVGGTVFLYSGSGPLMQVGDPTYTTDTPGFHLDNVVINTTASASVSVQGLAAYRTQEMNLQGLYFLGNPDQTGMTLDGTGNYTGGTFQDLEFGGFGTAVNAIGHQVTNSATTDWLNASTFLRLHINCPTSDGSPVDGTYGINLQQGDGNTFTGGDVEGCGTALHLGPNAQNNTIVGLRNENSISQVVADAGSAYNNWITGGTMFTGKLTDNGTRNSFLDTFHRSFNGLNGDWYGSQKDATITNHYRIGTGAGNERGLLNRYQTDYGYRWTTGLSDATAGEQFYQVLDELNDVYRISIGQYNNGQSSTNNQTVINAAGSGAVVLNGSANGGTGGVIFGAGGSTGATVATINNAGNAQFNGSLQVAGPSTFSSSATVKNQADAEIDSVLWAGATANQKESFIYKDYAGTSQWYMVKDASNNWALNSAIGGLDSFKAYQSNNSGDTYINASKSTGHIRLNYESGSGAETDIYGGSSSALVAAFLGSTAIKFPGLAAGSAPSCLQIDNSGYISNTGSACATGDGGLNGTVSAGVTGQLAYYAGDGTVLAGMNAVAVSKGGTGASTAEEARENLGAQPVMAGVASDGASGMVVTGIVAATAAVLGSMNNIANLASQTGSGSTAKFNSWLAAFINTRSFLTVDPQAPSGQPTQPFTSNNHLIDHRGTGNANGGPNRSQPGVPLLSLADGAMGFYSAADAQQPYNHASYANNLNFGFDCKMGGIYNWSGGAGGTKSNCVDVYMPINYWTAAQKWDLLTFSQSFSRGEHIGLGVFQTDSGGWGGAGGEPNYGVRVEEHQTSDTDGAGGVASMTFNTVNAGTGAVTYTPVTNGDDFGEGNYIRDTGNTYSAGSITGVVCTGSPNTCTVTFTGTTLSSLCPGGTAPCTMTTYGSGTASTSIILTNNHVICPASGAHDGYDWCVPITQIVDDTHLTSNVAYASSSVNSAWSYLGASAYVIYGSTYPKDIDRFHHTFSGCQQAYTGVTTCDVSGITSGHTGSMALAYNADYVGAYYFFSKHIGRPDFGGGVQVLVGNTAGAPSYSYGVSVSSYQPHQITAGLYMGNSGFPPDTGIRTLQDPSTAMISDWDTTSSAACFDQFWDPTPASYCAISHDHRVAGLPRIGWFGTPTSPKASIGAAGDLTVTSIANSGNSVTNGNLTVGGNFSSSNIVNGPYSNQILDSNFQAVGSTWTIDAGAWTPNAGLDAWGNTTATSATATSTMHQASAITMTTGNTYAASVFAYASTTTGNPNISLSLNTSGSDTTCQAGGSGTMPPSFTLTTTPQKFTVYCSPNVASDTLKLTVITHPQGTATVYISVAQVAGSPYCAAGTCTTTGPPAITTFGVVSGTGLLLNGSTVINAAGGFQVAGAATSGNYLRGNGSVFTSGPIQAADVPTLNQNTSGTAANLSGTPALPNGTTATTQTAADNTTKVATDAFVQTAVATVSPVNLTTAGQGGVFAPQVFQSATAYSATAVLPGANNVFANEWVLPFSITVRTVRVGVATLSSGQTADVCIYNRAGTTLLISTGGVSTTATGVKSVTLGSPVPLAAGVYLIAWTGTDMVHQLYGIANATNMDSLRNNSGFSDARTWSAATAATAGVCPSSLGVLTAATKNSAVMWMTP